MPEIHNENLDKNFFDKLRKKVKTETAEPPDINSRFASSELSELHRRFEDTRPGRGDSTNWDNLRTSEGETRNDKN